MDGPNFSHLLTTAWPHTDGQSNETATDPSGHSKGSSLAETIVIAIVFVFFSVATIVGNILVIISIKMDKQLQTISNYFLLSLSIADFLIGIVSMPLFSIYTILGQWSLGSLICDTWLAIDYLVSNASVLNLLIISFDRYFSVTRPLTYRAKRTTKKACISIAATWIISLLLWPPWIFSWPYIEGQRTVPSNRCYIQFLKTNKIVTFGTAIAAFYVPLTVMIILYWRIWRETKKRYRDLTTLFLVSTVGAPKCSSTQSSNTSKTRGMLMLSRKSTKSSESPSSKKKGSKCLRFDGGPEGGKRRKANLGLLCCWAKSGVQPKSRDTAMADMSPIGTSTGTIEAGDSLKPSESIYTIVIRLYGDEDRNHTIKMIEHNGTDGKVCKKEAIVGGEVKSDDRRIHPSGVACGASSEHGSSSSPSTVKSTTNLSSSNTRRLISGTPSAPTHPQQPKSERKAAKTLSAILLAFAITWTPYNVLVLIRVLLGSDTEDEEDALWNFSYYLCYLNSTVNPLCYALCNASFRRTYIRILKCKWSSKRNKRRIQKHWNLE